MTTGEPDPRAARLWHFRALAEGSAAARFLQLAEDLEALKAHSAVVDLARQAVADERRHVALCRQLTADFGGEPPPAPTRWRAAPRPRVGGLDAEQLCLVQVVGMCCLNETVSVAILTRMHAAARGQRAYASIHEILRDEVGHARIGWAHLADLQRRLDPAFVGAWLPRLLEEAVRDELFTAGEELDPPAPESGGLTREARRELFEDTVRTLVFPGLERFGVDTGLGRAWLERKLRGAGSS